MTAFDISQEIDFGVSYWSARQKGAEIIAFSVKRLPRVQVYQSDYDSLLGAINRKQRKIAREETKRVNERRKADGMRGKVKVDPIVYTEIYLAGIPIEIGVRQSKPRRYEA